MINLTLTADELRTVQAALDDARAYRRGEEYDEDLDPYDRDALIALDAVTTAHPELDGSPGYPNPDADADGGWECEDSDCPTCA